MKAKRKDEANIRPAVLWNGDVDPRHDLIDSLEHPHETRGLTLDDILAMNARLASVIKAHPRIEAA